MQFSSIYYGLLMPHIVWVPHFWPVLPEVGKVEGK